MPRMSAMMRALLAERFNLRTHLERRPGFQEVLVIDHAEHPSPN